ncbi:hypothetical protein ZWY2020_033548 [Hordeum vulgare]|nr:hypothetical protein ZWY2020_033548 [Hordeum vulgare]
MVGRRHCARVPYQAAEARWEVRAETEDDKGERRRQLPWWGGGAALGAASGHDSEAGGARGHEGRENGGVWEQGLHRRQRHCQTGCAGMALLSWCGARGKEKGIELRWVSCRPRGWSTASHPSFYNTLRATTPWTTGCTTARDL